MVTTARDGPTEDHSLATADAVEGEDGADRGDLMVAMYLIVDSGGPGNRGLDG